MKANEKERLARYRERERSLFERLVGEAIVPAFETNSPVSLHLHHDVQSSNTNKDKCVCL